MAGDEYGRVGPDSAAKERHNEGEWRRGIESSSLAGQKKMSPIETILQTAGMPAKEISECASMIVKSIEKMGVKAPPPEQEKTVGILIGRVGTPEIVRAVTNIAVDEVRQKQAFTIAPKNSAPVTSTVKPNQNFKI